MKLKELREQIEFEFDAMHSVIAELNLLRVELAERVPTVREKTAAAAFLAQLYGGIENVLKRISRYCGVAMPSGESWHVELFIRFCEPSYPPLPVLFDAPLATAVTPYRKFRHVFHHGYSFQFDWERMYEGVSNAENVLVQFRNKVNTFFAQAK